MPNVAADDLTAFAAAAYEAAGTPATHAAIVAAHQVGANLAGHDSHGVALLPTYVDRIDRGHIVPAARPEIVHVRYLTATPPAEGFDEVFYPGEIEYRTEQRRRRDGIPVEEATWTRLGEIGARFGLSPLRSLG